MDNIHCAHPDQVEQKIKQLQRDGTTKIHLVADFDKTLTKAIVHGQKAHTSIALIREGKYLTPDYPARAHALFDHYHPYEISKTISKEEKNKKMTEWWSKHLQLMIECDMNKEVINDIIKKQSMQLRPGTKELLTIAHQKKIPVLIFSAGLGDIIQEELLISKLLFPNIHIISNFYEFDSKGKVTGYKSNIVHTCNKSEVQLKQTPYFKEIRDRPNVIVLGDNLEDAEMTQGIEHKITLKIGFFHEQEDELLDIFSHTFDIVLNDASLENVTEIIKEIN